MYTINVTVEGIGRGLLMHKFSNEAAAQLSSVIKKVSKKRGSEEEEAEKAAYRLENGNLYLPAEHFLSAIIEAGATLQIQGKGKSTYKKVFKGQLDVTPDCITLHDSNDNPIKNFEVDKRPVVIQTSRIMRYRPFIKKWMATFQVIVNDDAIPISVVQEAIQEAGKSKCVGDYRPRFGQFRIVFCQKA